VAAIRLDAPTVNPAQGPVAALPQPTCTEIGTIPQPEARDAQGKITVEQSTIHRFLCGPGPSGAEYWIYDYSPNRSGFRLLRPPDWNGGRNYATWDKALEGLRAAAQASPRTP